MQHKGQSLISKMPSGEHLRASQVSLCMTINSASDSCGLICLNTVLFPSLDCNFQVHECLKQTQSQIHSNVTREREAISQPPPSQRSCCSLQNPHSHLLCPAGHPQAHCHNVLSPERRQETAVFSVCNSSGS